MYLGELGESKYSILKFDIVNPTQKTSFRFVTSHYSQDGYNSIGSPIVWAVFLG